MKWRRMEGWRGTLRDERKDRVAHDDDQGQQEGGPYSNDPQRSPLIRAWTTKPYNGEPPATLLTDNFLTPNELFYVRNHLPVPEIDPSTYRLEISLEEVDKENRSTVSFTLDQLKSFPRVSVTAAIQCSGNRRSEMQRVKSVQGLSWKQSAIGNAEWTGVRLRDVLIHAGISEEEVQKFGIRHLQFEGLDHDSATSYGASIPIDKAMNPMGDVILAFEMNGDELSRDHGYPVRVIAPGIVGARNVKWLGKVIASRDESQSHWQQKDYKSFSPSVDWDTVEWKSAPAIQDQPVQSAICEPPNGTTIDRNSDHLKIRGYAVSGGGRGIIRVDVSVDGGKNWFPADLVPSPIAPEQNQDAYNRSWAWTLWEARIPVDKLQTGEQQQQLEICCKAVDSSYNTQPDTIEPIWNLRGVLNNAWHRITVKVPPSTTTPSVASTTQTTTATQGKQENKN